MVRGKASAITLKKKQSPGGEIVEAQLSITPLSFFDKLEGFLLSGTKVSQGPITHNRTRLTDKLVAAVLKNKLSCHKNHFDVSRLRYAMDMGPSRVNKEDWKVK